MSEPTLTKEEREQQWQEWRDRGVIAARVAVERIRAAEARAEAAERVTEQQGAMLRRLYAQLARERERADVAERVLPELAATAAHGPYCAGRHLERCDCVISRARSLIAEAETTEVAPAAEQETKDEHSLLVMMSKAHKAAVARLWVVEAERAELARYRDVLESLQRDGCWCVGDIHGGHASACIAARSLLSEVAAVPAEPPQG